MEIGSLAPGERPHAVMIPYPAQGHVTPMLKLGKLLHARGFHVTFVNNEFNHRRLLRSQSADTLRGLPAFQFTAIADGLPPSDLEASRDTPALIYSTMTTCRPRFKELVVKLNEEAEASGGAVPPVTCVVADSITSFAISVARELGLRCAVLWTASACGFMGYYHYKGLLDRGLVPLKGMYVCLSLHARQKKALFNYQGLFLFLLKYVPSLACRCALLKLLHLKNLN